MVDDDGRPTPSVVTGAVSVGTAPLPFLAVYAALFMLHGLVHPVHPPDIGNSQDDEIVAGVITAAIFALMTATLVWFLNRHRRWPYAIVQLVVLGGCLDFIIDPTKGGRPVSVLLVITTVVSLFLGFAPDSWSHVGRTCPSWLASAYGRVGLGGAPVVRPGKTTELPLSTSPTMVEPAPLRRRRFASRTPDDG